MNVDNEKTARSAEQVLSDLNLEEKLSLLSGKGAWQTQSIGRLKLASMRVTDGPRGVAWHCTGKRATSFPCGIALGASWDSALAQRFGRALGEEAARAGCSVILGPGINICRTPLNGRTFEYFTEDPHLNSRLAVAVVNGIQSTGTAACVKHFAANNQETERMSHDVRVSERALREIYFPAFEAAVKEANVYSIMAAYNAVNGTAACENDYLLNQVLRQQWDYKGFVVSDWYAARRVSTPQASVRNGLNLEMPGQFARRAPKNLRPALIEGSLSEAQVDAAVLPLLSVMQRVGHFDNPREKSSAKSVSCEKHQQLAREMACAGMVLLKNDGALLPLDPTKVKKVAIVGPCARRRHCYPLWGGSSGVWAPFEITPIQGLKEKLKGLIEICDKPEHADVVLLFLGLSHRPGCDSEVKDKKHLQLPRAQEKLLDAVIAKNPNTVVVLNCGGPVEMPWVDRVPAILYTWYPGMCGGAAVADVLLGDAEPGGRLPITFPKSLRDIPAHHSEASYPGVNKRVAYDEGVFVGYRHFETRAIEPLFPFGHGLSYTSFSYMAIGLETDSWSGEGELAVRVILHNEGNRGGSEIVQLYIEPPTCAAIERPQKELKAFKKIFVNAGESVVLDLHLGARDFSYFDEHRKAWHAPTGNYQILIGSSSTNIHLGAVVALTTSWPPE